MEASIKTKSEEQVPSVNETDNDVTSTSLHSSSKGNASTNQKNFETFLSVGEDEIQVVEVDQWAPSRVNSLFYQFNEDSRKTVRGGSGLEVQVVLVTHANVPAVAINKLKEKFSLLFFESGDSQKDILQKVCGVDAIFLCGHNLKLDREMLDFIGKKLVVVGVMGAGYDHIDVRELTRRKIRIGNTRAVLVDTVAEVALGLALFVAHRFKQGYLSSVNGKRVTRELDELLGKQLSNSVCGIIGFGDIGSAIAKRLAAFNVKQIFYSGHGQKKAALESSVEFVDLEVLLTESDFVFIVCPLTVETQHMFTYDTFRLMRPTAILVNVGRGRVIKTNDLVKALNERLIWGAGLDGTDPEPLPKDHPLLHMPNCFVSPHIGTATRETREMMALLTADNIIAALEGQPMPSEVCFKPDPKELSETYSSREPFRTLAKHLINISQSTASQQNTK